MNQQTQDRVLDALVGLQNDAYEHYLMDNCNGAYQHARQWATAYNTLVDVIGDMRGTDASARFYVNIDSIGE